MAGSPFMVNLMCSFVVLLWLMSRVSGESEPSLDGKEDDESSKQRYNTLLDEIEKRYSGLMLPRMIGKASIQLVLYVQRNIAKFLQIDVICLWNSFPMKSVAYQGTLKRGGAAKKVA